MSHREKVPDEEGPRHRSIPYTRCKRCKKRGYADKGDALVVAAQAAKTGTQRVYECPHAAGLWHLTRMPKSAPCSKGGTHVFPNEERFGTRCLKCNAPKGPVR